MSTRTAERRRQAVVRILRRGPVGTQEELLGALRREGLRATQATLSRDLSRLGVRRTSRPGGGTFYELADGATGSDDTLAGLVGSVATNGSTVVVRTRPGSAPAVARAIDLARLPEVLGTIAGDDTIFVAPAKERRLRSLAAKLGGMFGIPDERRSPGEPSTGRR
ncbi:MAG TPA: arginine repressor [Anaeromyxobacteraceae bacterium]|nr:arginine repressor [Anaeromyxobacteraceae bacterium]